MLPPSERATTLSRACTLYTERETHDRACTHTHTHTNTTRLSRLHTPTYTHTRTTTVARTSTRAHTHRYHHRQRERHTHASHLVEALIAVSTRRVLQKPSHPDREGVPSRESVSVALVEIESCAALCTVTAWRGRRAIERHPLFPAAVTGHTFATRQHVC